MGKYKFQSCNNKWISIDGTQYNVDKMTTSHLLNAIRMVENICIREKLIAFNYEIYNRMLKEVMNRVVKLK